MPDAIAILAILATVSVKVFALVMMAAVAARVLRSASAACRHVLWTAVLASALAIAVMAPAPAMWSLPVGALVRVPGLGAPGFPATNPVAGDEAPPTTVAPGEGTSPARALAWVGHALLLIWVAGVAILALRIVAGQMILRRIAARGRPIEAGTARAALLVLAGRSRLRRVRMIETDAFMVPATWGLLRPVIALPAAAGAWPAPRLEAALRHELAHIRRGDALTQAVAEIAARLPNPPTATAVRTMLRILEQKGHLRHDLDGLRHVYSPVVPAEQANRSVLRDVVETFFQGSHARAMATLLELRAPLSDEELDRLRALIDRARSRR